MPSNRALQALLETVASGGRPTAVQITALSDLSRDDLARVREAWPAVDPRVREELLGRAAELAEDNVDLDFALFAGVALGDGVPAVRRRAVEALWENRDRDLARRIAAMLREDPDETVRAAAASVLHGVVIDRELETFDAASGDAVIDALRAAANDGGESIDVRARAVESLGPRTLPWVDTLINDAYFDADRRLRIAAIRAMGESAQERWLEFLEETAVSDDPELRFEVATALGAIASEDGIEILADLLGDEDDEVILAAINALGQIGGDEAVERLTAFAESGEGPLADAAAEAIDAASFADDPDFLAEKIGL